MKARGRRLFAALIAVMLLTPVGALAETSFEGTVTSGNTQVVSAPFGGTVSSVSVKVGDRIQAGDVVATVETTKVYAPQSGTCPMWPAGMARRSTSPRSISTA